MLYHITGYKLKGEVCLWSAVRVKTPNLWKRSFGEHHFLLSRVLHGTRTLGICGWLMSLSTITPFTSIVSSSLPPSLTTNLINSKSTSLRSRSATDRTASTAILASGLWHRLTLKHWQHLGLVLYKPLTFCCLLDLHVTAGLDQGTVTVSINSLNRKPRYKRECPSHFRQHLISILIKSCSARGSSELFPKDCKIKS